MKALIWLGSTRKDIRNCPLDVRREFGDGLRLVQLGQMPCDWKIMKGVGHGAKEIRVHVNNEYRLIYVDKFEVIYILHLFVKKTEKTLRRDIMLARSRYELLLKMRKS
jgi:phage-related protein